MYLALVVRSTACAALLIVVSWVLPARAAEPPPQRLSLEQALAAALAHSPALRARQSEIAEAEGRLLGARTYPFNPEVTLEGNRRTNGESTTDRGVTLGQVLEVGGQRGRRVAQATAALDASRAWLGRHQQLLLARVHAAFVEALRVRELLEVERANADLARSLGDAARKRLEAGAAAQMELNLAQVQVGRAERGLRLAEGAFEVALALLAEVVGRDPARPLELEGELVPPTRELPSLETLLTAARDRRRDLEAFRRDAEAARARIELARREAVPDLGLQAFYGREDGTDRLVGGGLTLQIPLFQRGRGEIAEARAAHQRSLAETEAAEIAVRQEVVAAVARYRSTLAASVGLQQQVLGTLEENFRLLERSFEAGKIDWTEVLVFRREFVDAQRDYIESVADASRARIELDLATGTVPAAARGESQP